MVQVLLVPGSLQRVCQLTGEHDRTTGGPVPSHTLSTAGLVGTDLGSSVDLGDHLVFLFMILGPAPSVIRSRGRPPLSPRPPAADVRH